MKGKNMKEIQKRYLKKIKTRLVAFYIHEQDLYDFSKSINFNKFIKEKLKEVYYAKEK